MKPTTSGNFFSRRWYGQLPLAVLLWRDMLGVGTLINVLATVLALAVMVQGAHPAVAVALHFAPLPYNVFLFAAVWRSPDGVTWSRDSTPPQSQGLVGVGAGSATTMVIAGQPGPASLWRSDRGTAWERDPGLGSRGAAMRSIAFHDGAWIVAGDRSGVPMVWIGR